MYKDGFLRSGKLTECGGGEGCERGLKRRVKSHSLIDSEVQVTPERGAYDKPSTHLTPETLNPQG